MINLFDEVSFLSIVLGTAMVILLKNPFRLAFARLLGDRSIPSGNEYINPLKNLNWIGLVIFLTRGYGWTKLYRIYAWQYNKKWKYFLSLCSGYIFHLIIIFAFTPLAVKDDIFQGIIVANALTLAFQLLPFPFLEGMELLKAVIPNNRITQALSKGGAMIFFILFFYSIIVNTTGNSQYDVLGIVINFIAKNLLWITEKIFVG